MESVTLIIATPKGTFQGEFPKTAKVKEVIEAVIEEKGLVKGDAFELFYEDKPLQPDERTLVSFVLAGTVNLDLVATGSGV